ncbi:hypothetical protein I4F81_011240 [Pyropia yezoensis]|uniref:Uncharacterized protein n=1 Tax=Pyropia yezoensis TaxID=2788 RepID=A0ACC3CF04_PYRYE|nr:hypothetical protein I4F81_011240 [Neopyropia yezoensis]
MASPPAAPAGAPTATAARAARRLGVTTVYPFRFIRHRGHVIADRGYNAVGREAAERALVGLDAPVADGGPGRGLAGGRVIGGTGADVAAAGGRARRVRAAGAGRDGLSASWSADNPNTLTLTSAGGSTREEKVTKRSYVDEPGGYGTFVSSEYTRIARLDEVVDEPGLGIGAGGMGRAVRIEAVRRVVKWAVSEVSLERRRSSALDADGGGGGGGEDMMVPVPNVIDALEMEATYPTETLDAHPLPLLVVKYRVFLSRPNPLRLK